MSSNSVVIAVAVVGNILSVVGVVLCNKYIVETDGFNFMIFLSFLHFAFTALGTRVLLHMDVFTYANASVSAVLPVAVGSLLSVAFMNLNLAYNSVGFYQLSKLACIPFTLIVQFLVYNQYVSRNIQFTLIPITLGVGWATVHDVDVNLIGTIFACCAVAATGMAQIFTSSYQKSLGCNAMQLLYHTAPLIAGGMLVMCPMFDNVTELINYQYTPEVIFHIVLSCVFALGVNITNYMVLGKTSPLTYQVLGHLKTVLILVLGVLMFNKQVNYQNVLGVVVAMIGVVAYTELKRRDDNPNSHVPPATSTENMQLLHNQQNNKV